MMLNIFLIQTSNSICRVIENHMKYENTDKFKLSGKNGFRLKPKKTKTKKVKRSGKNKRKDFFIQKGS